MLRRYHIGASVICKVFPIFIVILFLFIITGCNQEPKHEHTFSEDWSYDETSHWHASTCGHEAIGSKAPHVWGQGISLGEGKTAYECQFCHATKIDYDIGSRGPAGGIVFYDCDADNDETNDGTGADGLRSSVCGWRYLEAAPYDLFLIDGWKPSVDVEEPGYIDGEEQFCFGFWSDSHIREATKSTIGSGSTNTGLLWDDMKNASVIYTTSNVVNQGGNGGAFSNSHFGEHIEWQREAALFPLDYYPVNLCCELEYNGYGDWFLPSCEELNCLVGVLLDKGDNALYNNGFYWSSTATAHPEDSNYSYMNTTFTNGKNTQSAAVDIAKSKGRVRPIRAFVETSNTCQHDFIEAIIQPSCKECGYCKKECIICGYSYEYRNAKPLGHDYQMQIGQITRCKTCNEIVYGPAGGYIFYDCDADNNAGNADGLISSECGWRYLEVTSECYFCTGWGDTYVFGNYRTSPSGKNLYSNGSLFYSEGTSDPNDGKCTGTAMGTGKANTIKLINSLGDTAYCEGENTTSQYIARIYSNYELNGYSDWFLPSRDEMIELYHFFESINDTALADYYNSFWTSSESETNREEAYTIVSGARLWSSPKYDYILNCVLTPIRFVEGD